MLFHGLTLSSASFALFNPNESLAYILADAGKHMEQQWQLQREVANTSTEAQQVQLLLQCSGRLQNGPYNCFHSQWIGWLWALLVMVSLVVSFDGSAAAIRI